jgi:hypothetical protein
MVEDKKESKINFEELILRQLEVSIEMKERLQSKAASYITADALILGALLTFLSILLNGQCDKLGTSFYVCSIVVFCFGIIEFVICSSMLLPNSIYYFTASKLMGLHKMKNKFSVEELERMILKENQKYIDKNERINLKLGVMYVAGSIVLILLIAGFSVLGIMFFVSI